MMSFPPQENVGGKDLGRLKSSYRNLRIILFLLYKLGHHVPFCFSVLYFVPVTLR